MRKLEMATIIACISIFGTFQKNTIQFGNCLLVFLYCKIYDYSILF